MGGNILNLTSRILKGVMPTQASPLKTSRFNPSGINGRSSSTRTGQCAKSRSCQVCCITQGPEGSGQGRWAVWESISLLVIRNAWVNTYCYSGSYISFPRSGYLSRCRDAAFRLLLKSYYLLKYLSTAADEVPTSFTASSSCSFVQSNLPHQYCTSCGVFMSILFESDEPVLFLLSGILLFLN